MGYKVETYSLSELNRISTPGKVVPALFWMIPIGSWAPWELHQLWSHFTSEKSVCNELGLMLVKNIDFWESSYKTEQTTDLSELTGRLSDLLPSGIKTIYNDNFLAEKKIKNQILILSGSYPQPGWGLLFSLQNYYKIENLIKEAIDHRVYTVFIDASNSFKNWNISKENRPIKVDVEVLKQKKSYCVELFNELDLLSKELSSEHLNSFYFEILKKIAKEGTFRELSRELDPFFEKADDRFILAILILSASNSITEDELNSKLLTFRNQHNPKSNNLFIKETNGKIKRAASLLLKLKIEDRPDDMFLNWAKKIYSEKIIDINNDVQALKTKFQSLIGEFELNIDNSERKYSSEILEWQKIFEEKRLLFHKNLQEVLKCHLEYSPSFLINLEKQTQQIGISSKSVSWDPPRMVGWKILTEGIRIANFDIITYLKELIPDFSNQIGNDNINDDTLVNGSLFTDYVHYISKSDINLSPRDATKKLLEKLLRSREIKTILETYRQDELSGKTHGQLVEMMLVEFGWPAEKFGINNKLAECIVDIEGITYINKSFTGNDIRIICENFCKDLVDTLTSLIGYTASELFDLVKIKYREFNFQTNSWDYEISNLTIGSAIFIISSLLNEALPDKKEASENFINCLKDLRIRFNQLSHDPPLGDTSELLEGITGLLKYTAELVFEMPWHFHPVQKNGHHPTVLTGNAWSHSYKESRQLSIIIWFNDYNADKMLVWNPSRINPIIPDAKLLIRP